MAERNEHAAFAIRGKHGWLIEQPSTFGLPPHHAPVIFGCVRQAEAARRAMPEEERGYSSVVVIEWRPAETIGHTE